MPTENLSTPQVAQVIVQGNDSENQNPPPSTDLDTINKAVNSLQTYLKDEVQNLKNDAKDQKGYMLIGVFILGVMVATMIIMVGGMVYGVFIEQNSHVEQLNANIEKLLQTNGKIK